MNTNQNQCLSEGGSWFLTGRLFVGSENASWVQAKAMTTSREEEEEEEEEEGERETTIRGKATPAEEEKTGKVKYSRLAK
jgi:hypothetical protein